MMKPHCSQGTLIRKKQRLKDLDTTGTFVHSFSSVSISFEEERDGDSFLLLHSFHLPQKSFQGLSAFLSRQTVSSFSSKLYSCLASSC